MYGHRQGFVLRIRGLTRRHDKECEEVMGGDGLAISEPMGDDGATQQSRSEFSVSATEGDNMGAVGVLRQCRGGTAVPPNSTQGTG